MAKRNSKKGVFSQAKKKISKVSKPSDKTYTFSAKNINNFISSRWNYVSEVRHNIAYWLIGVGLLIVAVAIQFVWFEHGFMTTSKVHGGTYVEGVVGDINTLNPMYASSAPEKSVKHLVFSSLYNYDRAGSLRGDLAKSYSTDDEGKTYVVDLRHDAMWQDNKPLTADDVIFTINLIKNPAAKSPLYSTWSSVEVNKVDNYTIRFHLNSVYAPFLNALTFPILPKHVLKDTDPSSIRSSIGYADLVGSGPFKIKSVHEVNADKPYDVVRLVRNDSYYGGLARLDRIRLYAYKDQKSLIQAISNGDVGAASGISVSNVSNVDSHYDVSSYSIASGVYALFNTRDGLLKDQKIRKALQLGTNTKAIRDKYPIPLDTLNTPYAPEQIDINEVSEPEYNPKKAKDLLESDGWKIGGGDTRRNKDGDELKLRLVTIKGSDYSKIAHELVEQWKSLGIHVSAHLVDTSDPTQNVASTVLQPRNYDVLVYELFLGADPDNYAYWHSSQISKTGSNLSNFDDPVSDDILSSARSRLEPELRQAKYKSFAKQWLEKAPAIGLYQSKFIYASKPSVHAIKKGSYFISPTNHYSDVLYWTVRDGRVYKTP